MAKVKSRWLGENAKLPEPRVFQLPTDLDKLFDGLEDIGLGARYFAHVPRGEMHLELGGTKSEYISYLYLEVVEDPNEIVDGRLELIGPDINEFPEGTSVPAGLQFKVYGPGLTDQHYEYLERAMQLGLAFQEGLMLINTRGTVWIRVNKRLASKYSFLKMFQSTRANILTQFPLAEAVEARFIMATPELGGTELIKPIQEEAKEIWKAVDAKYADLEDEDVDMFYGCTICQTFAPNHICVVTPSRIPYCGILSYNGAKITYEVDPQGYTLEIPKGEVLNAEMGEYSGVNEKVYDRSSGTVNRVFLRSCIKYVTTNCGCFEASTFYIPEVDGIGIVHRRYFGDTPIGLRFSTLAGMISGGAQNHGFRGISMRGILESDTWVSGDGGWNRIVWLPKDLKLEVAAGIPEEIYDKVATEEDALDIAELKEFLIKKKHPIVEKFWKNGEPQPLDIPSPNDDWPD